jgi:hypothetical protein
VEVEGVLENCKPYASVFRFGIRTLQIPQATVHSSEVADAWLAWQSMHRSMMWLRQMAQLSTTMSHAQRATAFHCIFREYSFILLSVCANVPF